MHADVLVLAAVAATIAVASDLRSRRIPNWLTLATFILGVVVNAYLAGWGGALGAVFGAGVGLVLLLPFYAIHAMGAGDVKLLAALGAVLGLPAILTVAVYGALVGGVMSALILGRRGRLLLTLHELFVLRILPTRSGARAPYAVAIAGGVYLAMFLPAVVR